MTRTRKKPNRRARLIAAAYEHGVNTFDRREIRRFRAEWVRQAVADRAARTGMEGRR